MTRTYDMFLDMGCPIEDRKADTLMKALEMGLTQIGALDSDLDILGRMCLHTKDFHGPSRIRYDKNMSLDSHGFKRVLDRIQLHWKNDVMI